ncbi:MurR/RpiR family transcriptional regulator [Microbacterium lacticum]|uniref:MurR/RpiR family transcriptional regulator n=1 Tax=Microbacterium lacticum TaxID=33885 RepID=UPI0028D66FF0|nr:MurR/RpiR family transcriptional regulator [Microbacterium lacticum]
MTSATMYSVTGNALTAMHQRLSSMTPTERRVADYVIADPDRTVRAKITRLAADCGTSPTSIARFAKSLGFRGYTDFRLALAAEVQRGETERERFQISDGEIGLDDDSETTVLKVAFTEASAIERTARAIDVGALEESARDIRAARRVDIYGIASSGLAASDLQQKLHRAGLFAQAFTDHHLALTGAALLQQGDVAVIISHSGRTLEMVEAARIAHEAGAVTIAITNAPDSPLAATAERILTTAAAESRFRVGAMSSRIAQLAVVDFLFTLIAQQDYERISTNLRRTYDAVRAHRVE